MKKINVNNFKKTLSKFTTGVTVVCVNRDNVIYGKTVNSFSSLSFIVFLTSKQGMMYVPYYLKADLYS